MNEKIEQLAKQAKFKQDTFALGIWDSPEFQKFAKLIVQDICDWIEKTPSTEEGTIILTKQFIIANLKEHFGVE